VNLVVPSGLHRLDWSVISFGVQMALMVRLIGGVGASSAFAAFIAWTGELIGQAVKGWPRLQYLLADNAVHGMVGAACWGCGLLAIAWCQGQQGLAKSFAAHGFWSPGTYRSYGLCPVLAEAALQIVISYLLSCGLDADHFVAARSSRLRSAMTLQTRPFGHAVLFVIATAALSGALVPRTPLWLMVLAAWGSHHLRDALRRGLWCWPLGSTRPISMLEYLLAIAGVVCVVAGSVYIWFSASKPSASLTVPPTGRQLSHEDVAISVSGSELEFSGHSAGDRVHGLVRLLSGAMESVARLRLRGGVVAVASQ